MKAFTTVTLRRAVLALAATAFSVIHVPVEAHHGGAHFLDVYTVTCWTQNDPSGADEPYLKLNGSRIWTGPDCTPITTMYPGVTTTFWNQVPLEIMEDDFGNDDQVGYVTVGPQSGQGTQTYYSYKYVPGLGTIINYSMEYRVYQ